MFQLRWVWKQMDGFRKRYIFALCSTVLLSVMALGNSMITSVIMDTVFQPLVDTGVVTEQAFDHLIFLVAVLIGFTLFRTGFQYLSIMTYEGCSQKLLFKLRRDLYKNMQEQDQAFFSKTRTGDLMTRLTGDLDMVRFAVAWVVRQLIDCTVLFVTTSVVFLATDWLFALSMLAVTPIIFVLTFIFSKRVHPLYVDLRERLSQLNTIRFHAGSGMYYFTLVVNIIQAFQSFGQIKILTEGGPNETTNVIVYSIYRDAFFNYKFGSAAAQSVILFIIIMLITLVMFKVEKKGVKY